MMHINEHHAWSTFNAKSRDKATRGKNAADSNGAFTITSKQSVCHPSENIKVLLASKSTLLIPYKLLNWTKLSFTL